MLISLLAFCALALEATPDPAPDGMIGTLSLPAALAQTPPAPPLSGPSAASSKGEAVDFPDIESWHAAGEALRFGPESLWEHINGAADLYLAYGFRELRESQLDLVGSEEPISVAVGIYDMGKALQAFGVYRVEGSPEARNLKIAAASQGEPPWQWLLLKDRFYVKVEAVTGEASAAQGEDLLRRLAAALPGDDALPGQIDWLPAPGRVPHSEGFTLSGYLGLSELRNVLHADYCDEGEVAYPVFLVLQGGGKASAEPGAARSAEALRKTLSAKWTALAGETLIMARQVPYRGWVGLVESDHGLLGTVAEDQSVLIARLNTLIRSSPSAD